MDNFAVQELRKILIAGELLGHPDGVLINGYGPYNGVDPECWVLTVDRGTTFLPRHTLELVN